jgi:hypothetical protein
MKSRWFALGLYGLLSLIVLLPVLTVQVPALGDAINHIARMHVLAAADGSPVRRYYALHWPLSPYLAMDAVVPVLAQFMPVMVAARVFIGACLLMPPAAVAVLQWASRGRIGLATEAAFLLSQNMLLAFGFLNFLFMSGLAVMLFAAWIRTAHWPRWRRAAAFAPAVLVLYFGHIFACIGYCLMVLGFEVARAARARFQPLPGVALDWLAAGAQAVPALLLTPFFDRGQVAIGDVVTRYGNVAERLFSLASPVLFLSGIIFAFVAYLGFFGVILLARWLRIEATVWPAAAVLFLASLAIPHVLAGVWGADERLPLMAYMVALGGMAASLSAVWRALLLAVIVALTLTKSIDSTLVLQKIDGRIAQTRRVLESLPRGSRLLVMDDGSLRSRTDPLSPNAYWHIPLMAVIDRDAFVPYLFTGFMTVHPTDAVRDASTPSGQPLDAAELADGLAHPDTLGATIPDGRGGRIYWYGWRQKFDYLLVQHANYRSPLPGFLQPVAMSEVADLYKITQALKPTANTKAPNH